MLTITVIKGEPANTSIPDESHVGIESKSIRLALGLELFDSQIRPLIPALPLAPPLYLKQIQTVPKLQLTQAVEFRRPGRKRGRPFCPRAVLESLPLFDHSPRDGFPQAECMARAHCNRLYGVSRFMQLARQGQPGKTVARRAQDSPATRQREVSHGTF